MVMVEEKTAPVSASPPVMAWPVVLDGAGVHQPFTAGDRLSLEPADALFVVRQGTVDLFAARHAAGAVEGPRIFLGSVHAGGILPLLDPREGARLGLVVLAVACENGALATVPFSALPDLTTGLRGNGGFAQSLAHGLDSGLTALLDGIAAHLRPTRLPEAWIEPGEAIALRRDLCLSARKGLTWIPCPLTVRYLDVATVAPPPEGNVRLPLTGKTWLLTGDDAPEAEPPMAAAPTTGFSTAGLLLTPDWQTPCRAALLVAMRALEVALTQSRSDEARRLADREAMSEQERDATFARFAALLHPAAHAIAPASDEPVLYRCCAALARRLGEKPGPMSDTLRRRHAEGALSVPAIAQSLGLRVRQVALRGNWWQQDGHPLLAFQESDNQPVALLPTEGGYRIHPPDAPPETVAPRVQDGFAHSLKPLAWGFTRALPDREVGLWDLLRFGFQGARTDLLRVCLTGLLGGLLGLMVPLATGYAFDTLIPSHSRSLLLEIGAGMLVMALVMTMLRLTGDIALLRVEGRAASALQAALVDRLIRLPGSFFANYSAGDLASRALMVETVRRAITSLLVSSLLTCLFSLFSFVLLWVYQPMAALVASALIVALLGASVWAGMAQLQAIMEGEAISGNIFGLVLQIIGGVAKLRLAGAEDRAFSRWGRIYAEMRRRMLVARRVNTLYAAVVAGLEILALAAVFLVIALVEHSAGPRTDPMETGAFLAFLAAFATVIDAAFRLGQAVVGIFSIVPGYKRARPILSAVPESERGRNDPGRLSGALDVTNLSFRYPGEGPRILSGLTLKAEAGAFIALVGPSGCGKSTLIKLLLGFEQPDSGGIFYDGKDLRHLNVKEVRQQIGVVLQNGRLMPGSLFENIKGATDAGLDDAWEAARIAGIAEDIRQMPMGMHTILTEGSAALSGGQVQRLLIARAVVGRPRLLIFDEATSALDTITQKNVTESLDRLLVTRVVVAHRVSTIVKADRIYVLRGGRVVETGTYAQLMDANGPFVDLVRRQLI